jgi:hypothetical protein
VLISYFHIRALLPTRISLLYPVTLLINILWKCKLFQLFQLHVTYLVSFVFILLSLTQVQIFSQLSEALNFSFLFWRRTFYLLLLIPNSINLTSFVKNMQVKFKVDPDYRNTYRTNVNNCPTRCDYIHVKINTNKIINKNVYSRILLDSYWHWLTMRELMNVKIQNELLAVMN